MELPLVGRCVKRQIDANFLPSGILPGWDDPSFPSSRFRLARNSQLSPSLRLVPRASSFGGRDRFPRICRVLVSALHLRSFFRNVLSKMQESTLRRGKPVRCRGAQVLSRKQPLRRSMEAEASLVVCFSLGIIMSDDSGACPFATRSTHDIGEQWIEAGGFRSFMVAVYRVVCSGIDQRVDWVEPCS